MRMPASGNVATATMERQSGQHRVSVIGGKRPVIGALRFLIEGHLQRAALSLWQSRRTTAWNCERGPLRCNPQNQPLHIGRAVADDAYILGQCNPAIGRRNGKLHFSRFERHMRVSRWRLRNRAATAHGYGRELHASVISAK